jgi:thiamine-phosphate pyrophosphorylase
MTPQMLLYYITDRRQFSGDESTRQAALLVRIGEAARWGVDYIQLREKDLSTGQFEALAKSAVAAASKNSSITKLLINSRTDIAIAAGANGVHLRSRGDLTASDARVIFSKCGIHHPVIACSCHTEEEVTLAESHGADFAVFGPIFGKSDAEGIGLQELRRICKREVAASSRMAVLALGGVTVENAAACLEAGSAGVAGIRLFQNGDIGKTVSALRRFGTSPQVPLNRRHPYQSG